MLTVKPLLKSVLVSSIAATAVSILWSAKLLTSLQSLVPFNHHASKLAAPADWLGWSIIVCASVWAGVITVRIRAGRALLFVVGAILSLFAFGYLASNLLHIDILFVPVSLSAMLALWSNYTFQLWTIDAALTLNLKRIAMQASGLEGKVHVHERLMSGLRLLNTVLPLDEAIVFRLDKEESFHPVARTLTSANGIGGNVENVRNAVWREGIKLCERAISTNGLIVHETSIDKHTSAMPHAASAPSVIATNVALALQHEEHVVGALLLRLNENFDKADHPLLSTISAQFARDLHREEFRAHSDIKNAATLFSVSAAERRLDLLAVVIGLITEQNFAPYVLDESAEGHAIAYLDGTLAYVNPSMLRAAQLEEDELQALDLFGLLEQFRAGVFDEPTIAVRRVLQTGETYERELFFKARNQTLELRIALISKHAGKNGEKMKQALCLAVRVRDVTRMKEHEKLKSDMISLMSHELRTPITSINGFAELLMLDDKISDESREFLNTISSEAQRLTRMINSFLSVTKLEAEDRQELLKVPLLLNEVVHDAVTNLQSMAKRRRIRLIEKEGAKIPPVAADRSLMMQVISNLIDNAIKYSPERTAVTLSTLLEADAVRVVVEDKGYGIPAESIDRVWEKFYRVARDGHDKQDESTGLGLSFVREVIEQHGGTVALESEVGQGSKFSFTIPRL